MTQEVVYCSPDDLQDDTLKRLLCLMHAHYDCVDEATFIADIQRKDKILLLLFEGEICGFTSFSTQTIETDTGTAHAIFSGDTIVERSCWGKTSLEQAWMSYAFQQTFHNPTDEYFWFLLCKGYRTFRFLPVHFKEYHAGPCVNPSHLSNLLCAFGRQRFGESFDPLTGCVTIPNNYHLRQGIADITDTQRRNAAISRFEELNPNWSRGTELATLVSLNQSNLRPMAKRWLSKLFPDECSTY